ncbi:MAG: sensor histidine kinase [Gemmatimonadota bacterium]|nr:sensor histidine kinase [Gemmatimonadota bacterium]
MTEELYPPRFDVNASVVFRLGEELITDVVQALVELVKNSYDADATWVSVTIDTSAKNTWGRQYPDAEGAIIVEDDGHGMDEETIRQGWLTIANSPKRKLKDAGKVTRLGRTPIGDKGLGRLGSQRLARNVEIITQPRDQPTLEQYIAFSWGDFRGSTNLSDVPVRFEKSKLNNEQQGTKLILSGLQDRSAWQSKEHIEDLQLKLSGMLSPFEEVEEFRVYLEVDGTTLELAEIAKKVRDSAQLKYEFKFDGEVLEISGRVRLKYFQPSDKKNEQQFKSQCINDDGEALFKFLSDWSHAGRPERFVRSNRDGWFIEFQKRCSLNNIQGVSRIDKLAVSPGPFRGEVDSVSFEHSDIPDNVLSRQSEYREFVKKLAGIRVYRDGFGIRVGEDWLGLGKQQTQARSFYGLRPGNVLGFVAISAQNNPDLKETTSREGFLVTPHFENFFALLKEFIHFAGGAQNFFRRGVLRFLDVNQEKQLGVDTEDPHSAVTQRIDRIADSLSSGKAKVRQRTGSLMKAAAGATRVLGTVRKELDKTDFAGTSESNVLERLEAELSTVSSEVVKEEELLGEISTALDEAAELKATKEVLDRRWEALNEHVSAMYESISLGLTAEALSHEIHNIADRLASKSSILRKEMEGKLRRSSVIAFTEEVRSSVAAMRKQLAHLTPSLRYLRERREKIELNSFVNKLGGFYEERLALNGIETDLQTCFKGFSVTMNRGKLTQVFDNLVLNSEYWLKEAIRSGLIEKGELKITVKKPHVRISDNGTGVDRSVEDSLFEPFVTMKRTGEGRGLGLYVCRQLLDSESCDLVLLSDRNEQGRRFIFELDLSGAIGE